MTVSLKFTEGMSPLSCVSFLSYLVHTGSEKAKVIVKCLEDLLYWLQIKLEKYLGF